ncbi:site-specific integrase [Rhodovulum sp. BSW8]|uniref:tyrosine-type recombinase/integrase n=1 Tax=Rhodovulum sp. BSW8 TaxID=2259645 RepID=UPI000DE1E184|nr:site-specific integrase [Rhodovulum sp. BSW8]RBO54120.1 site-specific integrase [Rhodovulum sp. BSW8]
MANLTTRGIKAACAGKHDDGSGLRLVKASPTSGKWVFRYSHLGKRREMGLGSWPEVGLATARKERDRWAAELRSGQDPINLRDALRRAEREARDKHDPTFAELAQMVFEAKKAELRGDGDRGRWFSPLRVHVIPKIGRICISQLTAQDIRDAMSSIWQTKPPTAEKAWQRTRLVLREGKLMGFECDPFTADAAQRLLGTVSHTTQHIHVTPWQDMPALYARLDSGSPAHECLRFMMLTLVRYMGCAGARANEVDGDVWTVPAERVKGQEGRTKDFRVPLPVTAREIVDEGKEVWGDLLFPGRSGAPITSRAIEKALDSIGEAGRPHGFRASFRTWVQDTDACDYDVAETILGHTVGNRVERTYARSDLLERRRPVMDAWERHVTGCADNVVKIKAG